MALRPVQVVTDSYGRWWYTPPADEGQQVRASVGPFDARGGAVAHAAREHPGAPIMVDGVTVGASKPPPLPRVDRDEERRRAGLRPMPASLGTPPAATAPVKPPPEPRAPSAVSSGMEGRPQPAYGEPQGYGQGQRFEEEHGRKAGELGGEDPLAVAQRQKQSMREAVEAAKAGI
jgi:hypothetical protein